MDGRLKIQRFFNNRFLKERGMASTSKMEYQIFLSIFQKNSAMAILGLKEIGKFFGEGRDKGLPCWQTFMKNGLDAMSFFLLDDLLMGLLKNK